MMTDHQARILAIYKEIAKICDRNGITYFATGGTCIGAVRHHGFIPWDDDLDIAVPIEQFEILKDSLRRELPPYMKVLDGDSVRHYKYIFIKVTDTRTTVIHSTLRRFKDAYMGVFVDIMPLIGTPGKPTQLRAFVNKARLYFMLNIVRRFPLCDQRSRAGKLLSLLLKLPLFLFRFNYFSDLYLNLLKQFPMKGAENIGCFWLPTLKTEKLHFPSKYFSDTVDIPFEDTVMKCPAGYHDFLTDVFGNYMELPPVEARKTHKSFVDLEHPYSDYQNGVRSFDIEK